MDPSTPEPEQVTLFDGGYTKVTLELYVHLDAESNTVLVGHTLLDTPTRQWIGAQAFDFTGPLTSLFDALTVIRAQMQRALEVCNPFP